MNLPYSAFFYVVLFFQRRTDYKQSSIRNIMASNENCEDEDYGDKPFTYCGKKNCESCGVEE